VGAALRPDLEEWDHGTQPLPLYTIDPEGLKKINNNRESDREYEYFILL